jgi:YgiT-type zinc finger domain-containing protein
MERELKSMIALKARIAFNGDIKKLVRAAVENFEVKLPEDKTTKCPTCGKKGLFQVSKSEATFRPDIVVEDIPVWECPCGEILYDVSLFAEIEAIISQKTETRIGFDELLRSSWPKQC